MRDGPAAQKRRGDKHALSNAVILGLSVLPRSSSPSVEPGYIRCTRVRNVRLKSPGEAAFEEAP